METLQIISNILVLFLLGFSSILDYKTRKISIVAVATGFACGTVLQIIIGQLRIYEMAGGCVLGLIFLLVARLTGEAIGYGDGLILIATGAFLGIMNNLLLLTISLALAAVFSISLLVFKRMKKNKEIPFVPFMLGGFVIMVMFF